MCESLRYGCISAVHQIKYTFVLRPPDRLSIHGQIDLGRTSVSEIPLSSDFLPTQETTEGPKRGRDTTACLIGEEEEEKGEASLLLQIILRNFSQG